MSHHSKEVLAGATVSGNLTTKLSGMERPLPHAARAAAKNLRTRNLDTNKRPHSLLIQAGVESVADVDEGLVVGVPPRLESRNEDKGQTG